LAPAKPQRKIPQQARAGYRLVVVCESCGEVKRPKYRSDALQWQRQHLAEHARHEVGIVERPERRGYARLA
jgi:RNase P subunit RPR2